jgi:hypothetical protein
MAKTRDEIGAEAGRIAGTVNNIIPNMEDHIKEANKCKPLDQARRGHVAKVQEYVKRLQEEQKKLEQLIKLFQTLKPDAAPENKKTGLKGVVQSLNPAARGDKTLMVKMQKGVADIKVAVINGNKLIVEK